MKVYNYLMLILSAVFLFTGCEPGDPLDNGSFKGDWYMVALSGHNYVQISEDNVAMPFSRNDYLQQGYEIVRNEQRVYETVSKQGIRQKLGELTTLKKDTLIFSNGYKFVRLTQPTKGEFSRGDLTEWFNGNILSYQFDEMEANLYPGDSLNIFNFRSADFVQTGKIPAASHSESWTVYNFKDVLTLIHTTNNRIEYASILIEEVLENSFNGTLFRYGREFPVTVKMVHPIAEQEKTKLRNSIIGTKWTTAGSEKAEKHIDFKGTVVRVQNQMVSEWQDGDENRVLNNDETDKGVLNFTFNDDGTLTASKSGYLFTTYRWKVSKDGSFIFVYGDENEMTATPLATRSDSLQLRLSIPVGNKDTGILKEDIIFTLKPTG